MNQKGFSFDYKKTLTLPQTSFPIKTNLEKVKEEILKYWQEKNIYEKILEKNKKEGKGIFVLHDGPPYANGNIHVGHVLNKVLKDIVVKYKILSGYYAPYIPGWDCHGLPIEYAVIDKAGLAKENLSPIEVRQRCQDYALNFVNIQRKQFEDLGVFGLFKTPYLTLNPQYEAAEMEIFLEFFKKGLIFRQEKPVFWCPYCESALAEAEVEYQEKKSPSLFLKLPFSNEEFLKEYPYKKLLLVWTTTPWTLPGNVAFAINPKENYIAVLSDNEIYILMKKRLPALKKFFKKIEVLKEISPDKIKGKEVFHPFFDNITSSIYFADFVSPKEGTGVVHIAPAHGLEDFKLAQEKSLALRKFIDQKGKFDSEIKELAGVFIEEANLKIVEKLKEKDYLFVLEEINHSYPHCWRCHNPIIFRATPQWFIKTSPIVEKSKKELENVKFYPPQSKKRLVSMLEERPDWCISRQRKWGLPIPSIICQNCGQEFLEEEVIKKTIDIFKKEGSDAWFKRDLSDFVSEKIKCPSCGGQNFIKGENILDVWFDSGASYYATSKLFPFLPFPADLYLEGSDQHRGWFQSSLLIHTGGINKAPYKAIVSHGFCVDSFGEKMSKSKGNVIDPEKVKEIFGTEILRLWVALSDWRSDVRISSPKFSPNQSPILESFEQMHFKIRNTFRFLLANLYDYEPSFYDPGKIKNVINLWILAKNQEVLEKIEEDFEKYQFFKASRRLYNFMVEELSSIYFDVIKDKLYTWGKNSPERREIQMVLYKILLNTLPLIAPILSFLAEEVFLNLPFRKEESVFYLPWPQKEKNFYNKNLLKEFDQLINLRAKVNEILEEKRKNKEISSSLEAKIILNLEEENFGIFKKYQEILPEFLICSEVILKKNNKFEIKVEKTSYKKCQRCWKYLPSVGNNKQYPEICEHCFEVIKKNDW